MTIIAGLTSQPKQQMTLQIADGSNASFYLEYVPQQLGWFFNLVWGATVINGGRLTTFPNILRQWQNVLPFGIAVMAAASVEPLNQTDLSDGTVVLLLLTADDVALVEAAAFPGN